MRELEEVKRAIICKTEQNSSFVYAEVHVRGGVFGFDYKQNIQDSLKYHSLWHDYCQFYCCILRMLLNWKINSHPF